MGAQPVRLMKITMTTGVFITAIAGINSNLFAPMARTLRLITISFPAIITYYYYYFFDCAHCGAQSLRLICSGTIMHLLADVADDVQWEVLRNNSEDNSEDNFGDAGKIS
jgi:hypothetical protein